MLGWFPQHAPYPSPQMLDPPPVCSACHPAAPSASVLTGRCTSRTASPCSDGLALRLPSVRTAWPAVSSQVRQSVPRSAAPRSSQAVPPGTAARLASALVQIRLGVPSRLTSALSLHVPHLSVQPPARSVIVNRGGRRLHAAAARPAPPAVAQRGSYSCSGRLRERLISIPVASPTFSVLAALIATTSRRPRSSTRC